MKRILILDQDAKIVARMTKNLAPDQFSFQIAEDPDAALRRLKAWKPHILIVGESSESSDDSWANVVSRVRSANLGSDDHPSLLVVSDQMPLEELSKAFDQGADAFLRRSFEPGEILAAVLSMSKLKDLRDSFRRASHRVEELGSVDDLTGLMNMRTAYRRGDEEILRSRRLGKAVSAMMLNLDGFSAVNQSYGFMTGSMILQEVGKRIRQNVRQKDLVARLGADEFFLLLPDTDLSGAREIANQVKQAIQSFPFKSEHSSIRLTASVGVACLEVGEVHRKMSDLLHAASEALRVAKGDGPNQLHIEARP